MVAIHNIMSSHIFKMDLLGLEKLESFVCVLQTMNSHSSSCRTRLKHRLIVRIAISCVFPRFVLIFESNVLQNMNALISKKCAYL